VLQEQAKQQRVKEQQQQWQRGQAMESRQLELKGLRALVSSRRRRQRRNLRQKLPDDPSRPWLRHFSEPPASGAKD